MKSLRLTLPKGHKLCSHTAVESLFNRGGDNHTAVAYPIRAVWRLNPSRTEGEALQFLISVPKRHFKHAVDRVRMRRIIREAYRLNRHQYAIPAGYRIDMAFLYISPEKASYATVEQAMRHILAHIARKVTVTTSAAETSMAAEVKTQS